MNTQIQPLEIPLKGTATQFNVTSLNTALVSSTAHGASGEIRFTFASVFWCNAPNSWIRVIGSTF